MTPATANRTQPALYGGLVMGVLSALPIVSAGNWCCCLWVLSGGLVAAYVLQQNQATPITPGDGAFVGLLAGLIGAVIDTVLSVPISFLTAPYERMVLERVMSNMGGVAPEYGEMVTYYGHGGFRIVLTLCLMLVVGAIFSTIGGLIGAIVFRKQLPPGTIDVTPPPAS